MAAMSLGRPERPSGVWATMAFSKSESDEARRHSAFGFDDTGVDGINPDLFRAKFFGEHTRDRIDRSLVPV